MKTESVVLHRGLPQDWTDVRWGSSRCFGGCCPCISVTDCQLCLVMHMCNFTTTGLQTPSTTFPGRCVAQYAFSCTAGTFHGKLPTNSLIALSPFMFCNADTTSTFFCICSISQKSDHEADVVGIFHRIVTHHSRLPFCHSMYVACSH